MPETNTESDTGESEPPAQNEIESRSDAVDALRAYNGATILSESYARTIASQFDVDLVERLGELEAISNMDRLQPDNDNLGIGAGTLCQTLCERIDSVGAEDYNAAGHARTQRGLKAENLPTLEGLVG